MLFQQSRVCFVKPKTERVPQSQWFDLLYPALYSVCEKSSAVAEGLEVENTSVGVETNCGLEIANTNTSSWKETQTNRTEDGELLLQGKVRELETKLETLQHFHFVP